MLARLTAAFIVIFWIAMMGLLIRNEYFPENSRLREIPPAHVLKMVFVHEQPTLLQIHSDKQLIGQLTLTPSTIDETGDRRVDFAGNVRVRLANGRKPRLAWDGRWIMGRTFKTKHLTFGITMQDFTGNQVDGERRVEVEMSPAENRAHVVLKSASGIDDERDYSMDQNGARNFFRDLGIDPMMMAALTAQKSTMMTDIHARQSSLKIHGERVETYLVSIEQAGQTMADFAVNQIG